MKPKVIKASQPIHSEIPEFYTEPFYISEEEINIFLSYRSNNKPKVNKKEREGKINLKLVPVDLVNQKPKEPTERSLKPIAASYKYWQVPSKDIYLANKKLSQKIPKGYYQLSVSGDWISIKNFDLRIVVSEGAYKNVVGINMIGILGIFFLTCLLPIIIVMRQGKNNRIILNQLGLIATYQRMRYPYLYSKLAIIIYIIVFGFILVTFSKYWRSYYVSITTSPPFSKPVSKSNGSYEIPEIKIRKKFY